MPIDDGPSWQTEGRDWPNRETSRFVTAGGLRWHVQLAGQGPAILLVHGTGAATHSWRALIPLLADRYTVVAPDLPGHGFTQAPDFRELSLPGMSASLAALLRKLDVSPVLVAGHSAGAAILIRMCLDRQISPQVVVSLNGALLPLHGAARHLFAPAAKLMARLPLLPGLFARHASHPATIARLLKDTGSRIDPAGQEFYRRLAANPRHVASALGMMANWELDRLADDLPRLKTPLVLVVGSNDLTIPPEQARRVHKLVRGSEVVALSGLGHLAHEERPEEIMRLLIRLIEKTPAAPG
jgi:magnesium chelatase accessory protein